MPAQATAAATVPPAGRRPRGSRLGNARIRTKLALILLVPLVAIAALAGARLAEGATRAVEADRVQQLAAVSVHAAQVGHQLHQERVEAIRLLSGSGETADGFNRQSAQVDDAAAAYQQAAARLQRVPALVQTRLAALGVHLGELAVLRQQVLGDPPVATPAAMLRYQAILADIGAYQQALAGVIEDPTLSEQTRAVAAMSTAAGHAADAEAVAQAAVAGGITAQQREVLRATQTGQQAAFVAFRQVADPAQRAVADAAITGANVTAAATAVAALLQQDDGRVAPATAAGLAGMVDVTRFVQRQLLEQLLASATRTRAAVSGQVVTESALVLAALVAAVGVAVALARMLASSLLRLRASAVNVAQRELPAAVRRLSDPTAVAQHSPDQLAAQVQVPDRLRRGDEIGQVAAALFEVHKVAVRIAAEQAALRTSVAAMFLNLARRSQTLVDNMIRRLDTFQRDEQDPDTLAKWYTLDNLATRMRRNDENLLVLAGADSSPPRSRDALIADVLQAAQSEIEHYQRVEFGTVDDDVHVAAGAVNDVVRLLAELLDNATRYSPPQSAVLCEARRLGEQLIVQIEDRGVGMTGADVDTLNTYLTRPGELDVTSLRQMGVAVVARLAARHHIHVQLQAHPHYGTTAPVTLPRTILLLPASRQHALTPPPAWQLPAGNSPTAPAAAAGQPAPPPRRSSDVLRHAASRRGTRPESEPPPPALPAPAGQAAVAWPADLPVAGRPAYLMSTATRPPPAVQPAVATVELPIFQQVETAWFATHGDHSPTWREKPGHPNPPPPMAPAPEPAGRAHHPAPAADPGEADWPSAADGGWAAAAAAATPTPGGATSSGLPTRVPQAQLVPGGVDTPPAALPTQRRAPEQVRGLLSAYQRGVQRGRATWT